MIKSSLEIHFGGREVHLIREKILESVKSVLPIALIVLILSISITPIESGNMILFLLGTKTLMRNFVTLTQTKHRYLPPFPISANSFSIIAQEVAKASSLS